MVPGLSQLSYGERLRKLRLPTLAYRRARGDMIQVFKLTHDKIGYDKSLPPLLTLSKTKLRGHSKKLYMSGANKDVRKYSFNNRVINIWNSLPDHLVKSKTVKEFERGLDDYWKNQELKYDNHHADISVKPLHS